MYIREGTPAHAHTRSSYVGCAGESTGTSASAESARGRSCGPLVCTVSVRVEEDLKCRGCDFLSAQSNFLAQRFHMPCLHGAGSPRQAAPAPSSGGRRRGRPAAAAAAGAPGA